MNEQTIKDRIEGRTTAEQWLAELSDGRSEDWLVGFSRALEKYVRSRQNLPADNKMTEAQAKVFAKKLVGFGQHAETRWSDVPLEYRMWLYHRSDELVRYMLSDKVQDEIAEAVYDDDDETPSGVLSD